MRHYRHITNKPQPGQPKEQYYQHDINEGTPSAGWMGHNISHHIALGHTRLSIIDLSSGDQPMVSKRYALSYNGEIYNYR